MHYNLLKYALVLSLVLLSGCASLFGPDTDVLETENLTPGPIYSKEMAIRHWQKHSAQLSQQTHWQIMGKIGLFNEDEAVSLNLFWQQMGNDYEIIMSNPFGTPVIEMKKQGETLWLRIEQEQEYWGSDPQDLIKSLTGWKLPIEQMPQWLKGLPGDADYQLSNQGVIKMATLDTKPEWRLQYKQYKYWQSQLFPNKMVLNSGHNKVKLAISEWTIKDARQ